MDPISFNETFVKDIFDEIGGINGKRKGFDLDREIATATNDGTTQDKCNYSARDEDGCIRQNETIPERSDSITGRVSAEFDDDDVASLSNESEDYRYQDMGETSDGSKYWFPSVDVKYKPKVGDSFESVESAEKMYRKYANEAGFDIRLSNKKINKLGRITSRFYVCSKEGRPQSKYFDSLDVLPSGRTFRNSNIKRSGCGACLKIHFVKEPNQYEVYKFVEQHNHILFNKEEMRFSRFKRKLHYADHKNVFHGSSSKVGVTKSHRFMNAVKGGVDSSGGTVRDHQNFKRDMAYFVGNTDAQMLLNVMANRRKELLAIFWADETARSHYREFGDAISFDATFRTNKHVMIFVLFVAIDNHKKSVVVRAALIHNESVVDYTWVLKAFVKAHGRQPCFVITDQCALMKQAIPIAFPESRHRLCMWHITKKVKSKFVSEFNKLVWNVHLGPNEFEMQWNNLIEFYGLRGDPWLDELYDIRESWIPAYYKDYHMSGLMKTASRSESINAFFNVYAHFWHDLVVFLRSFDNAIESQRATHGSLEVTIKSTIPRLVSPCKLEAHAAEAYTRTIFFEVQKELRKAVWLCRIRNEKDILSRFVDQLEQWDSKVDSELHLQSHTEETTTSIKEFLGVSQPETVDVLPPTGIRNKGCGTGKRLINAAEKAISNGKSRRESVAYVVKWLHMIPEIV
ncbi:protein FAR1-RELATED SEQUENCE 5-like [Cynara cardunculus var. scolymus]|uniref:protein FAR1-RELATED SEQUENCE 5-like n=1 Tax=Cynara cardunculus var. scolymus TaxID=59895 RepID=UPI000D62B7B9|nr:protein FAR1-RELATED SEQUENCE 5-like [Cynara cardunculus var. scolymus]